MKLSKRSSDLLKAFDEAAQIHGWEADQGSREGAAKALADYERTHKALHSRLLGLEKRIETLKKFRSV
jgi:hypothetical protein